MRLVLANSFTEEEVRALDRLLSKLQSGGDARLIARSPEITSVHKKFLVMRAKADKGAQ